MGGASWSFPDLVKICCTKIRKYLRLKAYVFTEKKHYRYLLPYAPVVNCDLSRLINSDEIQSSIKTTRIKQHLKKKFKKQQLNINNDSKLTYNLPKNMRKIKISELYKKLPDTSSAKVSACYVERSHIK